MVTNFYKCFEAEHLHFECFIKEVFCQLKIKLFCQKLVVLFVNDFKHISYNLKHIVEQINFCIDFLRLFLIFSKKIIL